MEGRGNNATSNNHGACSDVSGDVSVPAYDPNMVKLEMTRAFADVKTDIELVVRENITTPLLMTGIK